MTKRSAAPAIARHLPERRCAWSGLRQNRTLTSSSRAVDSSRVCGAPAEHTSFARSPDMVRCAPLHVSYDSVNTPQRPAVARSCRSAELFGRNCRSPGSVSASPSVSTPRLFPRHNWQIRNDPHIRHILTQPNGFRIPILKSNRHCRHIRHTFSERLDRNNR